MQKLKFSIMSNIMKDAGKYASPVILAIAVFFIARLINPLDPVIRFFASSTLCFTALYLHFQLSARRLIKTINKLQPAEVLLFFNPTPSKWTEYHHAFSLALIFITSVIVGFGFLFHEKFITAAGVIPAWFAHDLFVKSACINYAKR